MSIAQTTYPTYRSMHEAGRSVPVKRVGDCRYIRRTPAPRADAAMITVDMHRGHLDPAVATMPTTPETAQRVIAAATDALTFARERAIPLIHMVLTCRRIPGLRSEGMSAPFLGGDFENHG